MTDRAISEFDGANRLLGAELRHGLIVSSISLSGASVVGWFVQAEPEIVAFAALMSGLASITVLIDWARKQFQYYREHRHGQ